MPYAVTNARAPRVLKNIHFFLIRDACDLVLRAAANAAPHIFILSGQSHLAKVRRRHKRLAETRFRMTYEFFIGPRKEVTLIAALTTSVNINHGLAFEKFIAFAQATSELLRLLGLLEYF